MPNIGGGLCDEVVLYTTSTMTNVEISIKIRFNMMVKQILKENCRKSLEVNIMSVLDFVM